MVDDTKEEKNSCTTGAVPSGGVAGQTNNGRCDVVAPDLVKEVNEQKQHGITKGKVKSGLYGKYEESKKTIESFKKREVAFLQAFPQLLGPVVPDKDDVAEESKETEGKTVRVARDMVGAGKRVVSICDTSGSSINTDTIVLTLDLSHLESQMKPNTTMQPKSYKDDAESTVVDDDTKDAEEQQQNEEKYRKILGLIKLFIANVHNCTIVIKCKIITGTVELHDCSNVKVRIESTATVATVQADLSKDIVLEFWDAPSGKNTTPNQTTMFWGEDKDDRIFHAGITNMKVCIYRDGYLDTDIICDYMNDGAEANGNATEKECQFITSCLDGKLITEKVVRTGTATGKNVRAMTERELAETKAKKDHAAKVAI